VLRSDPDPPSALASSFLKLSNEPQRTAAISSIDFFSLLTNCDGHVIWDPINDLRVKNTAIFLTILMKRNKNVLTWLTRNYFLMSAFSEKIKINQTLLLALLLV
jgi:hypothetical protein